MTNTNFLDLITKLSRKMKHMKVDLTIYDAEEKITYTIARGARNSMDKYRIVFDEHNDINVMDIPDSYYATTVNDLKELLVFIIKHENLYVTKLKNDCMECDLTVESLDTFLDQPDEPYSYDTYTI